MYNLKDALTFTKASEELIQAIKEYLHGESEDNKVEDLNIQFNGEHYSVIEVEEDDVVSEGKYENGGITYQLIKYDATIYNYPCEENILEKYDIQIYLSWYRTGSYYSDWYYSYDAPILQRIIIKDVPEVVIPAHQEVEIKKL